MSAKTDFWITNIARRPINLEDLNISIPSFASFNLLSKHYHFTLEQLTKSATSGSIFKNQKYIKIRKAAPTSFPYQIPFNKDAAIISKERSGFDFKEEKYEELDVFNNQLAQQLKEDE